MQLSHDTISAIQQHIDIIDIVSDFVTLKKKGQNFWACCPFHNEKTPSFSVSPGKGIYKCFGCGKAGDAIQFVKDMEGLSYVDTMVYLAKKYGIEIEVAEQSDASKQQEHERDSLFIVLNFAKEYYKDLLWSNEEGKAIGLSYFKERGFLEKTIKKFDLGYALNKWDGLYQEASKKGYQPEILEKAGLLIKKNDKTYDRFRERVIFPIHNVTGKVIAFGARILKSDVKQPKYINSPETDVYQKSKVLYGIFQAKQAIRQANNCYLVEGYTDVISLHQAGIENVVASSGTSLTEEQVRLLSRYTEQITVLFDGDTAGIKASLRGINIILEGGVNVKAVSFPEGEDPDSYLQKIGSTAFQTYLKESSRDFITFKLSLFIDEAKHDPIKKATAIKEVVDSISKIADPIKRAVYIKESSSLLEIDESVLIAEQNKILIKKNHEERKKKQKEETALADTPPENTSRSIVFDPDLTISFQERESIRLLVNYGNTLVDENTKLCEYLLRELDVTFSSPLYKEILDIYKEALEKGTAVDANYLLNYGNEEIKKEVIDLITERYELSESWEHNQIYVPRETDILNNMIFSNILRLKFRVVGKLIKENMEELKQCKDPLQEEQIQKVHQGLKATHDELASLLKIDVAR